VDLEGLVRLQNRFMIGFDLALGSATLIAPRSTLRFFGHEEPSPEVIAGFRRLSWVWLTFAAAHANAERRDEPQDWWALAWLRGTEMLADPIWSFSGVANTAMTAGFAWMATRKPTRRARLLRR
jgi:hypothetical protein